MTRSNADIGAGLAPARPGRPLAAGARLHVVGIGGTAALGAALHARALGLAVTGYDEHLGAGTRAILEAAGIDASEHHDAAAIARADIVAASKAITSIDPDQADLAAARARGLQPIAVQQVIADAAASRGGSLLGVAGTHGKTTSTGWLLQLLRASGRDPSAFVGGPLPAGVGTPPRSPVHIGVEPGFVVEADEYGGNFDPYAATGALILNADWDHPDIFADRPAVIAAFARWAAPVLRRGIVVVNVGDAGGAAVAAALRWGATGDAADRLLTYAIGRGNGEADIDAASATGERGATTLTGLRLSARAAALLPTLAALEGATLPLGLVGEHNAANGLGVAVLAAAEGATPEGIRRGLAEFTGVGRRLEPLFDDGARTILDDYGHHPTALDATISAARARYPGRPLWLLFEPLTYHRTAALLEPLAASCAAADRVWIADIHASRDPDRSIASAAGLAERIVARGTAAAAPGGAEATAEALLAELPERVIVLVAGGGRSTDAAHLIAARLTSRAGGAA